jgi:hypothetical protein
VKRLFVNGHNVRKGYVLILEETGEAVAHRQKRLPKVRALVERFNRIQGCRTNAESAQ